RSRIRRFNSSAPRPSRLKFERSFSSRNRRRRKTTLSLKWMSMLRIAARILTKLLAILLRLGPPIQSTRQIILLILGWFGASMEKPKVSMLAGLAVGEEFWGG